MTISTGGLVKNEKYYCTNALKHRQEAVDMRNSVSLGESPGFGQKPRESPANTPYAIM